MTNNHDEFPAEGFVEGNHPGAYDPRGNFQGNLPDQTVPVPAETQGYQAPGGTVRRSIRDKIAAIRPYKSELVTVPEWDVEIEVRSISLGERTAIMETLMDEEGNASVPTIMTHFILACSFDPETGDKVFAHDDLEFINSRAAGPSDKLGQAALRLSGMGKTVENAEAKKSSPAETPDSSS